MNLVSGSRTIEFPYWKIIGETAFNEIIHDQKFDHPTIEL